MFKIFSKVFGYRSLGGLLVQQDLLLYIAVTQGVISNLGSCHGLGHGNGFGDTVSIVLVTESSVRSAIFIVSCVSVMQSMCQHCKQQLVVMLAFETEQI